MSAGRYRADYYLFRHFLMGMGSFRDGKVISHEAIKLIFGINQPFRIRLQEKWYTVRAALLDGGCPHFLNGKGDWQIVLWIDPGTSLWHLLKQRSLKGRPWALHDVNIPPAMSEVIQTVGDTPDPRGALNLAEMLIRVYSAAVVYPSTWDDEVKRVVEIIDANPGIIDINTLAADFGRDIDSLDEDFRRVVGSPVKAYLHRRKWIQYLGLRHGGMDREKSLELSGLPGWEGLRDRFEERYALDLHILESSLPFVRVYQGSEDQPVLYL